MRGGRILNIGSIASQVPRFGSVPYTTIIDATVLDPRQPFLGRG